MAIAKSLENNPIKALAAYAQTSQSGRFQRYTDDWFDYPEYPKTEIMDFGMAQKTQVAIYAGLFDNTCLLNQTRDQVEMMGPNQVTHYVVAPF